MKLATIIYASFITFGLGYGLEAYGVDYYFSTQGNDLTGKGTRQKPWATLKKANSLDLEPGDRLLLRDGEKFIGQLNLNTEDAGSNDRPVIISSWYGKQAYIYSPISSAIKISNASNLDISNLTLAGSNHVPSDGLLANANQTDQTNLTIDNVSVSGFQGRGISVGGWGGYGWQNVQISNSEAFNNKEIGIFTWAQNPQDGSNHRIENCLAYGNGASGIIVSGVKNAIIQKSLAHSNGKLTTGSVGIWAYDADNVTIQFNESYGNKTNGKIDGGGFDLDGGVTNSRLQYNYSHDNDGAGFLIAQYLDAPNPMSNNTIRYNISENDGRNNKYGAITIWDGSGNNEIKNLNIYGNTIFVTPSDLGNPRGILFLDKKGKPPANVFIFNNIFYLKDDVIAWENNQSLPGLLVRQNNWFSPTRLRIIYNGKTHNSLKSWQSQINQAVGYAVDPELVNPGEGGTINNPEHLSSLNAYRLLPSSPLQNQGVDLKNFNLSPGKHDFFGVPIPQSDNLDIGAAEIPKLKEHPRY